MKKLLVFAPALVALASALNPAQADSVGYYVARDNTATLMVGGQPTPNPNHERLTLLFNHGDHFHSIGRFGSPTGQLPEAYIGGRITLWQGTGDMAGRFVSQRYDNADPASEYSDLRIESIHNLAGFAPGTDENVLYNSSGRRWSTLSLDGGMVALELVEASAGLHARVGSQTASQVGDRLTLGAGNTFSALLHLFTDTGVGMGTNLSATFRLVDLSTGGPLLGSGNFRFDVQTIPEPGSIALVGLGLIGVVGLRRRLRRGVVIA